MSPGRSAATALRTATGRLVTAASIAAGLLSLHSWLNSRWLLRPHDREQPTVTEPVSVLVPARDEEATLPGLLADLRSQRSVPDLEILVIDDRSSDATAAVVARAAADDPRIHLLSGEDPPPGWLGKPHACARLAAAARGSVLVFLDADVRLTPDAVASAVTLMRARRLDALSPYPQPIAVSAGERLVQPLLAWSWLTTMPLGLAASTTRPALAAANGQFFVVDAAAYRSSGGHGEVRGRVLEDIALMQSLRRHGFRGVPADGSRVARCRMYDSWREVEAGYTKSLWEAFGSRRATAAVLAGLCCVYVLPPAAMLAGSRAGLAGYLAAVAGRVLSAQATGSRRWPDPLAHPVSILLATLLSVLSWRRHDAGTLTWKGRPVTSRPGATTTEAT